MTNIIAIAIFIKRPFEAVRMWPHRVDSEIVACRHTLPLSGAWGVSGVMVVRSQGRTQAVKMTKAVRMGDNQATGEG